MSDLQVIVICVAAVMVVFIWRDYEPKITSAPLKHHSGSLTQGLCWRRRRTGYMIIKQDGNCYPTLILRGAKPESPPSSWQRSGGSCRKI
jgi:hypothetical protein